MDTRNISRKVLGQLPTHFVKNPYTEVVERILSRLRAQPGQAEQIITWWAHPVRQAEITRELIEELLMGYTPDSLDVLEDLWNLPQFIRAMGRNSMMVPVTLETLNSLKGYTVTGLIDSGATNGFISRKFVEAHHLDMEPLPWSVPVYNADGTPNKAGRITHVVRLRLRIQDHTEVFPFAITDTG
ncbi:hypothetical protein B0H19DRAFT_916363, partial [Mycena capillaripes]